MAQNENWGGSESPIGPKAGGSTFIFGAGGALSPCLGPQEDPSLNFLLGIPGSSIYVSFFFALELLSRCSILWDNLGGGAGEKNCILPKTPSGFWGGSWGPQAWWGGAPFPPRLIRANYISFWPFKIFPKNLPKKLWGAPN